MTTQPTRRPTRDEAIDDFAREAAALWNELTPEQQARIVARRKAAQAQKAS